MRYSSAPLFLSKQLCLLVSQFIKGKLHQIITPSGQILLLKSAVVLTHILKGLLNKFQHNCWEVTKQLLSCRKFNKEVLNTVLKCNWCNCNSHIREFIYERKWRSHIFRLCFYFSNVICLNNWFIFTWFVLVKIQLLFFFYMLCLFSCNFFFFYMRFN